MFAVATVELSTVVMVVLMKIGAGEMLIELVSGIIL